MECRAVSADGFVLHLQCTYNPPPSDCSICLLCSLSVAGMYLSSTGFCQRRNPNLHCELFFDSSSQSGAIQVNSKEKESHQKPPLLFLCVSCEALVPEDLPESPKTPTRESDVVALMYILSYDAASSQDSPTNS